LPCHSRGLAEPPIRISLILTTGRLYGHWHTQTRTGRLRKFGRCIPSLSWRFILVMNLGIQDQDWLECDRVAARPGFNQSDTGDCFWYSLCADALGCSLADKAEANALTHPESDPDSLQPELKASAVHLCQFQLNLSSEELGTNTFSPPLSV